MAKFLVIVESPAKAKTIAKYLGDGYIVESSIGHIRDLPATASEIPAAYKNEPWSRLGVDVDNDFKPLYVVPSKKKDQVRKLKQLVKGADGVILATDEDREGESIAWHLLEVLSPTVPVKRMVFHEITKSAVQHALEHTRELDRRLVDAQEARRILDRLYGYEVSPVLWKKVGPKLSAGRVQSVATRLIVERERERMRFRAAEYWDIEGVFAAPTDTGETTFGAKLLSVDGKRIASGKDDFSETGELINDVVVLDEGAATRLAEALHERPFQITSVEEKPYRRSPYPPFITSTLQQEAGNKLRFGSQRTMQIAQRLYENGYITYMRTDSTTLSGTAIAAARAQISQMYGDNYLPKSPRQFTRKVKNAQEAHEAIRPAGDRFRTPKELAGELHGDELKLYDLIWKRTVASQMADAVGRSVSVRLEGEATSGETAGFGASGTVITFPGYLKAYAHGEDEEEVGPDEALLPDLAEGQEVRATSLEPKGHATQPPPRYTEARLVKELEARGIGRPSTYASIIGTIQDRGYVWKKGSALVPSFIAFSVVGLMEGHFSRLVDYGFTALMEDDLDQIANGEKEQVPWLKRFYFGNGDPGLKDVVSSRLEEIDAKEVNSIPLGTDTQGRDIIVRVGKYGPYLQRGDDTASIPDDLPPDELTIEKATEILEAPSDDRELGTDPETGLPVFVKAGRYGPYFQLGELEEGSKTKPKTASLFKDMDPKTVTLEDALRLLSVPRAVGTDPADGEVIEALNGRYGPYLKKGKDTRSLETEDQIFTVTLDQALALFAQPKTRGRRSQTVIKELGDDPTTGKPMSIKDGRFGPYITDGETNVSVPRGVSPETISPERASDMLAEKRAKGPVKKKTTRKKTSKKTTAKKTSRKSTTRKTSEKS
ncbi:MAG: type I DNA topoisomerase [Actinomycetota bacterium]